jgi:prepilin-type processing-associated H-X9-DG protein
MFLYFSPNHNTPPPVFEGQATGGEMRWQCINRHSGFVNAVFLDFSARKIGLKELWTLQYTRKRPPGQVFDTCGPWTTCGGVQPSDWPEWMQNFQDY